MKTLFPLRRPGILVVSGIVKEINGDEVVIENDLQLPVSGTVQSGRAHLDVSGTDISKMRLKPGDTVIASTSDNFLVEMLKEGAESPDKDFYLKAHTIRYNGSFDFDRHGTEKEQHVFSGTVVSAQSGRSRDKIYTRMVIAWKKNGKDTVRNIVFFGKESMEKKVGSRIITITEEAKQSKGISYFQAKEIYDV